MFRYFKGKIRKFVADPPEFLEDIVEEHMPYMGTVHPAEDFYPDARADELKEACDGFGTNEDKIIDILAHHSNEQRQGIKEAYREKFGESLTRELKSELRSDFEQIVVALLTPTRLFDAKCLRDSMTGAGTREWPLIEIMCTRSNEEIENIKEAYNTEYERDLEEDFKSETGGYFQRLLVSQLNGARDESSHVDKDQAAADAQAIFDAGEEQWGTDEAEINTILCERNYDQLKETFEIYKKIADRDIEDAIESECTGSLQDAFLAIVKCSRDTGRFFAKCLRRALAGAGTEDRTLIRILVSRSELDLACIAELYDIDYGRSLKTSINGDCTGDFKKILMEVLGELAE